MPTEVAVACGGAAFPAVTNDLPGVRRVSLSLASPDANVRVQVADVHNLLRETVPAELLDLIEVAAYVYAADQSAPRGAGAACSIQRGWSGSSAGPSPGSASTTTWPLAF